MDARVKPGHDESWIRKGGLGTMICLRINEEGADLRVTRDELHMLNNALNEVCNGVHIHEDAFQTRLAFERSDLRALLAQIGGLLPQARN
ncbi:hypothetical protein ABIB73_006844 [Bradyrhizobium sp. F1.4.3]|uniref:hypothetical protein n=1 Tax=Bradyrhizobium sp. F1.4.3 TaxID=3156356 RepID=UPI003398CAD0